jgi:DNA polymerase
MESALRSLLNWYGHVGVDTIDVPIARPARRVRASKTPAHPPAKRGAVAPIQQGFTAADPTPIAAACQTIKALKIALDAYDAGPLSDGAQQAVLSRGNPAADLMVIGEAPGRDEDRQGLPFVGRSGQLLDRMLGAIGLTADDFYVGNVCFWRPPNNRKPDPAELDMCRPFVNRHIELANPKLILLAGGTSMQVMTGVSGIMKNRGQWQSIKIGGHDIPALPIYHPAFLLRQPALKAEAWQDLLTLRERLIAL